MVLNTLSQGTSHEEPRDDHLKLEEAAILAYIPYAHAVIAGDSQAPIPVRGTGT